MTEPHTAVITRLSADFAAIPHQLARVSADLTELDRILTERPAPDPTQEPAPERAQQPAAPVV
ncbi:DUF2339 domain-containing protein, partial [Mycobacterium sp. ITM-2017-0098]